MLLLERAFESAAEESRRKKNIMSGLIIGEGALLTGVVGYWLLTASPRMTAEQRRVTLLQLAGSIGITLGGVLQALFYETGTSRAWRHYLSGQRLPGSNGTTPPKGAAIPKVEPLVSSSSTGALLFGLRGTF